jgi:hypothetical protein
MKKVLLNFVFGILAYTLLGQIVYVDGINGNNLTGNGTSINPYSSIQYAIDQASVGDTVLVLPGIYYCHVSIPAYNITVGSLFLTTSDTNYINLTILDGMSDTTIAVVSFTHSATTLATRFCGFTIRHGVVENYGGGLFCITASPTLDHLKFIENQAFGMNGFGGGLYCHSSGLKVSDCYFYQNEGYHGASIFCYAVTGQFSRIKMVDNYGISSGGIMCSNCSPGFDKIIACDNSAIYGSVFCCYNASPTITNSLFYRNDATYGTINIEGMGSSPNVSNVTFANNTE